MLQSGSLGVLTGEVGAGKSTLTRHLVRSLDPILMKGAGFITPLFSESAIYTPFEESQIELL
ncbi:MAG: hypothetical protein KGZ64_04850 [Thermaerobacter sp.]|nr:hypothetical protein [Thermaerobacter sp.]